MLPFPDIDPVALSLGPLKIHWYGLMYLFGFAFAWLLGNWRAKQPGSGWNSEQVSDLIFYCALGLVLGARIGYMLFYQFESVLANPLDLFKIWQGGMSFHGGAIGVTIGIWLFGRKYKKDFFSVTDFLVPLAPLGLFAGRMGNFINGELWGRTTDSAFGMVFPNGGPLARHPSQLYEAILEGLVLFLILWFYSSKPRPKMAVSGLFLLGYGLFRSFVEFFREPDAHLGFIAFDWLTMGQILSLPMIIGGLILILLAYRKNIAAS
ncbi:MAG TPA: prolipoprotein diacylglyceryl transferase [Gammaproteobacteria bacterium]|nr:prolipoprotein diacylglyceryl transferase [Gammaproteobacteria bacterium]